jgi:hypothetical protein
MNAKCLGVLRTTTKVTTLRIYSIPRTRDLLSLEVIIPDSFGASMYGSPIREVLGAMEPGRGLRLAKNFGEVSRADFEVRG